MSNTISWGKIYEITNFGKGVIDNTISWGKAYVDMVSAFLNLLNPLKSRSDNYENQSETSKILQSFNDCEDTVNELLDSLDERSDNFENRNGTELILNDLNKNIDVALPNDNILILIAGQSNARGSTGNTLPTERHLNQYIKDTYIWTSSNQFERLLVNVNNESNTRSFGAELSLGYELSSKTNGNIYLVKVAVGGTGFRDNRWNQGDDLYNQLIQESNNAINQLNNSGISFTYGGIYWNQGEQDSNGTQQEAENYYTALTNFITNIRTDINGATDLDFIFTRLGTTFISRPQSPYGSIVRANQELINVQVNNTTIISTDNLDVRDDDTHYTNDSQVILGEIVANIIENNL